MYLNVTEILVLDFKNAIPGIFNFTVGILPRKAMFEVVHWAHKIRVILYDSYRSTQIHPH